MSGGGKTSAVVIGASGAIGGAFEAALIEEAGFDAVHGFARSRTGARHIDLLDEATIAAAAAHVAKGPPPRLVLVATGVLHHPEKTLADCDPQRLAHGYAVNALGPALVAKHFLPLMPATGRTVFAALSARAGSIAENRLGGWHGYRASKAALNMLMRTAAAEARRRNDRGIVVALDPGAVDTPLTRPLQDGDRPARLIDPERAALQLLDVIEALKVTDSGGLLDSEGQAIGY